MKKIIYLSLILLGLASCINEGDYNYKVYKKDGSILKVYSATPSDGMISIIPNDGGRFYYISQQDVIKIDFVGHKNIHKDKNN